MHAWQVLDLCGHSNYLYRMTAIAGLTVPARSPLARPMQARPMQAQLSIAVPPPSLTGM
jgi:hypothetical protein